MEVVKHIFSVIPWWTYILTLLPSFMFSFAFIDEYQHDKKMSILAKVIFVIATGLASIGMLIVHALLKWS